jgi:hypothetical protein
MRRRTDLPKRLHRKMKTKTVYNRIPLTTVATEKNKKGIIQWQGQWDSTEKGAAC